MISCIFKLNLAGCKDKVYSSFPKIGSLFHSKGSLFHSKGERRREETNIQPICINLFHEFRKHM